MVVAAGSDVRLDRDVIDVDHIHVLRPPQEIGESGRHRGGDAQGFLDRGRKPPNLGATDALDSHLDR